MDNPYTRPFRFSVWKQYYRIIDKAWIYEFIRVDTAVVHSCQGKEKRIYAYRYSTVAQLSGQAHLNLCVSIQHRCAAVKAWPSSTVLRSLDRPAPLL